MQNEIWIDIEENGDVKVEGKTATLGADCKKLTAAIEDALGTVVLSRTKPEFYTPRAATRKAGV